MKRFPIDRATSRPYRVAVDPAAASEVLPGWSYADAFECRTGSQGPLDARALARALLTPSAAARRVLALRDLVVRPLGLRPVGTGNVPPFPLLAESAQRVVAGFDDRHLDFRVVVTVSPGTVRCTTVVRRHGRLGTVYFAVVGPFHRRLVPRLLVRTQDEPLADVVVTS